MRRILTALVAFSMLIVGCGVAAAQTSETIRLLNVLRGHEGQVESAAFSPDGPQETSRILQDALQDPAQNRKPVRQAQRLAAHCNSV